MLFYFIEGNVVRAQVNIVGSTPSCYIVYSRKMKSLQSRKIHRKIPGNSSSHKIIFCRHNSYDVFTLPNTETNAETNKKWVVLNCVEVFILHRQTTAQISIGFYANLLVPVSVWVSVSVSVSDSAKTPWSMIPTHSKFRQDIFQHKFVQILIDLYPVRTIPWKRRY